MVRWEQSTKYQNPPREADHEWMVFGEGIVYLKAGNFQIPVQCFLVLPLI